MNEYITCKPIASLIDAKKRISDLQSGQKKASKKKNSKTIEYLFIRFSAIYGFSWDKDFNANPEIIANEWSDTLNDISYATINKAIAIARSDFPSWPPKPGEFLKICKGEEVKSITDNIDRAKASEIALQLIKKKLPSFQNKDEYFRENAIFTDLYSRIQFTQSEHCDFATCYVDGCYNYKIFDKPVLHTWHCPKHAGI